MGMSSCKCVNFCLGRQAQINVTYAEETLTVAEEELNNALDSLQTEGKDALEKARQRAKEYGQQSDRMTAIAHEARQLADDLDNNAEAIIRTASEAKNKSIEAYELAKNATDLQRNVSQDIRSLRNEIASTEAKLKEVKRWTEEVYNKSSEARNKTLLLLNEASNLVIPDIDMPKLKKQVNDTKLEAQRIINETEKLLEKNDKLITEVNEQILTSKDLLGRGIEQQDITSDLLSDIDLARASADNAINLAMEILREANATFDIVSRKFYIGCFVIILFIPNIISDFDKQVKEHKAAAERALSKIPEIQQIIREAINKTGEANMSLADSKENADYALQTAMQANEVAKQASQMAQSIRNEAEELHRNATGLKNEAGLMAGRVENTEIEYQKLLSQTEANETLISEANAKVTVFLCFLFVFVFTYA